ncbi:MAG TPA: LytTR family DNA-binding domain-containing protein [Saprospiraceae bacterium]
MKAIIIEDENLIARELAYMIAKVDPDLNILQTLPSVRTSRQWLLENAEPDLIFADIQLNDGISFEIFDRYELTCPVIFITAYDEYAIRAFKVNGVDYLLKPTNLEELKKAIDKARVIIESRSPYPRDIQQLLHMMANPGLATTAYREKFVVKFRNQWHPLPVKDIACIYRDELIYILTFSGEKYMLEFESLDEIIEMLDPSVFYRTNRHSIVNINAIQSIKPRENQKLTLTLKAPLKLEQDVSREKAPLFKKWFDR